MDLDELQSVQSRERQATSLQNLRSSFYQDAGEFIDQLTRERDRTAERTDDPFSSPEVRRLTDDIQTAKQTVEAIYERRVGKVVKMASIAAADMPTDEDGLTDEEAHLFDTLVDEIKDNRDHVLDEVFEGDGSNFSSTGVVANSAGTASASDSSSDGLDVGASPDSDRDSEPTNDSVDAADLMGGGVDDSESSVTDTERGDTTVEVPSDDPPEGIDSETNRRPSSDADDSSEESAVDRTTVRITRDIGEIFGVDERSYDLSSDDVVTLPAANAEPLVEQEAAEKLE